MDSIRPTALVAVAPPVANVDDDRAFERRCVERTLAGDEGAFRALVERHTRGIFMLVIRMVPNRQEAEDLVQETFTKAYRSLADYDPTYRLSTWLYRIALNTCRDHRKSPRRLERPAGAVPVEGLQQSDDRHRADVAFASAERAQRVRRAVDRLSDTYREVIVLKDLQELSYDEIHRLTGCPVTALKIRALRARARLRELLAGEEVP